MREIRFRGWEKSRNESVKGKPVVVSVDGEEIHLDYELLRRFTKSLNRYKFYSWVRVAGSVDRRLIINYDKPGNCGTVTFKELPARHRDLLQGLPKINISGAEGEG